MTHFKSFFISRIHTNKYNTSHNLLLNLPHIQSIQSQSMGQHENQTYGDLTIINYPKWLNREETIHGLSDQDVIFGELTQYQQNAHKMRKILDDIKKNYRHEH
jgi:hypothetical protein